MKTAEIDAFGRPRAMQFAIATLEGWEILRAVIDDLRAEGVDVCASIMLAAEACARLRSSMRADDAAETSVLLADIVELHFPASKQRAYCTAGKLADALSRRQAEGARSLAEALTGWLLHSQAVALEGQIDRGRLVLWLELSEPKHHGIVCGRLVRASIDIVEVCKIDP
jgi:hypothetical protein